jgi:hypothetical protein
VGAGDYNHIVINSPALSTIISTIANQAQASWTGWADDCQASVVFIWPQGQKLYLDCRRESSRLIINRLQAADDYRYQQISELLDPYF